MVLGVLGALATASCNLEQSSELALELELGSCDESDLSSVRVLSVEVYGSAGGSECALARRCIAVDAPTSVDELRTALRDVNQPLVEVDDISEDLLIVVTGHSTNDCFDFSDRAVCGFADFRDRVGGAVNIALNCSACPTREYPLCP